MDLHSAWHLGMAFPFARPGAAGGHDVPQEPRRRGPEDGDPPEPRSLLRTWLPQSATQPAGQVPSARPDAGPARKAKLFDIARGLPQRIEGQCRRHWGFVPALQNLCVRDRLDLGASLGAKRSLGTVAGNASVEQCRRRSARSPATHARTTPFARDCRPACSSRARGVERDSRAALNARPGKVGVLVLRSSPQ